MSMLKEKELTYIEKQISERISVINREFYSNMMNELHGVEEEYSGWTDAWLTMRIRDLFHLIQTYLEGKGMPQIASRFVTEFKAIVDDDSKILKTELLHPEGEAELILIDRFERFLSPFSVFDYRQLDEPVMNRLISILKESCHIIQKLKSPVTKEASVYNEIKWILTLFYPTAKLTGKAKGAAFIQHFKNYQPDILIPELKVAIEYKLIKSDSDNLDDFLDQLKTDSINYKGDSRFDNFIAVIYIVNSVAATVDSINEAWKAKEFPKSWTLVVTNNSGVLSPGE